jgi:hypothetical protein
MPPALRPLQQTTARIAAVTGLGYLVVAAPMALLSAVPPVSLAWLLPALAGYGVFVAVFARVALARGLVTPLVLAGLGVTVVLVAFAGRLIPLRRVDESSSWTAGVALLCVMTLAMAWRPRFAVAAGLLVVGAFLLSFPLAGLPAGGADNAAVLVLQLLSAVGVMALLRRASAAADTAVAAATEARAAAAVAQARRADVNAQLRLLHDTALTTLTLVGTGAVGRSDALAGRAAADLAALDRGTDAHAEPPDHLVPLGAALAAAVRAVPSGVDVEQALEPCMVPAPVADAFAGSLGEALRNVQRHAGVSTATLALTMSGGRVRVEVADRGRGFDPSADRAHRYGVRRSIVGRMAEVGGRATVESAPGAGTRWTLEWPCREA